MSNGDASPSRKRTLCTLAAAIYVPQLVPLLGLGPLTGCDHCMGTYTKLFPVTPGAFLAFWLGRGPLVWGAAFVGVWLFGYLALRAVRTHRAATFAALGLIALLSGLNALGFSVALRA